MNTIIKTVLKKGKNNNVNKNPAYKKITKVVNKTNFRSKRLHMQQSIMPRANKFNSNFSIDQKLHYRNLRDPWGAVDARWYRENAGATRTAKPITSFKLLTNPTGNFVLLFDPDFCSGTGTQTTAFLYCNDVTLTGATQLSGAVFQSGPPASSPVPPASTVLRTRLVSAGIKATVKLSALNNVGTILTCDDYGDLIPSNTNLSIALGAVGNLGLYTQFQNVLQGNNGRKIDIIGEVAEVCWTWYPMDPTAEIFNDLGQDVGETGSTSNSSGCSPKAVIAFEALNNGAQTTIEFEIVWNFEYVSNPIATPWIGSGGKGIGQSEHIKVIDMLSLEPHISMTRDELQNLQADLSNDILNFPEARKTGIYTKQLPTNKVAMYQ